jgi:hypothetical protein
MFDVSRLVLGVIVAIGLFSSRSAYADHRMTTLGASPGQNAGSAPASLAEVASAKKA